MGTASCPEGRRRVRGCVLPQPVLGLQLGLRRTGDGSMTMTGMGPQTPYGAHGFPNCGNVRSLGGPCSKKPVVLQSFCFGRDLSNIHGQQLSTARGRPVKPPGKARAVLCITTGSPRVTRCKRHYFPERTYVCAPSCGLGEHGC